MRQNEQLRKARDIFLSHLMNRGGGHMSGAKKRVFISSVQKELEVERVAISGAVSGEEGLSYRLQENDFGKARGRNPRRRTTSTPHKEFRPITQSKIFFLKPIALRCCPK